DPQTIGQSAQASGRHADEVALEGVAWRAGIEQIHSQSIIPRDQITGAGAGAVDGHPLDSTDRVLAVADHDPGATVPELSGAIGVRADSVALHQVVDVAEDDPVFDVAGDDVAGTGRGTSDCDLLALDAHAVLAIGQLRGALGVQADEVALK